MTADVVNLYGNLDLEVLSELARDWAIELNHSRKYPLLKGDDEADMKLELLIRHFLENNYVFYDGNLYRQTKGIAMGTNCGPQLANLYMAKFERKLRRNCERAYPDYRSPIIHRRYIDDIFAIFIGDDAHNNAQVFLNAYNLLHDSIKITSTISTKQVEFLDLTVYIDDNNTLQHTVYEKTTSLHLYLPFTSYHTFHTKIGWIKAELLRFARLNSTEVGFIEQRTVFFRHLRARGYPTDVINRAFNSVAYTDRIQLLRTARLEETPHTEGYFSIRDNPHPPHRDINFVKGFTPSPTIAVKSMYHPNFRALDKTFKKLSVLDPQLQEQLNAYPYRFKYPLTTPDYRVARTVPDNLRAHVDKHRRGLRPPPLPQPDLPSRLLQPTQSRVEPVTGSNSIDQYLTFDSS